MKSESIKKTKNWENLQSNRQQFAISNVNVNFVEVNLLQ